MSVWSSESDGHDRMTAVVSEYKASTEERVRWLEAKIAQTVELLRYVAKHTDGMKEKECLDLADQLHGETR